ncbi:related to Quinate permease [Sporisorium reilianum SRZ2]|uniref:Related to Quinate permease n=1 Tax=Sporisorium reilianum (strain SRZ2) TaxID=999809 RepID=E7A142_SPORE|nr:related to Quinate permease [Sporisorium reilianum SRZ2]
MTPTTGGGKRWVPSKLRHVHEVPSQALNWRLLLAVLSMGLLGASRGMDEGVISGSIGTPAFEHAFNVKKKSSKESNIVAMVQLLSTLGALVGYATSDRFGRVMAGRLSCVLIIIGSAMWMGSANRIALLYVGRMVTGVGVGISSVCSPVFLVETAPRQIRGLCTSVYSVSIYLGAMLGYAVNLGASRGQDKRKNIVWQVVVILPMVWHTMLLLSTFLLHESPRWLLDHGHVEQAARSLKFYRNLDENHPAMLEETQLMRASIAEEHQRHAERLEALPPNSLQRRSKTLLKLKLVLTSRKNLLKVGLGVMIQVLVQFGGPGAIATYANRIMTLVGASDKNGYVMSVGFGATKLGCGILSSLLLIDLLGRRKTLLIGVAIQGLSMLYVAIFLGLYVQGHHTKGEKHAGQAALAAIFISGASFSAGGNLAQYLVGTEIFEMHVRSLASSLVMAMHYLLQFSATRALQPMLNSPMGGAGTFAFYAAVSLVLALPFYAVFLPETAGLPLEEIDQVFERPVWAMGRATRARESTVSSLEGGENKTSTLPQLRLDSSAASSNGMDDDDKKEDLASQLRVKTSS